MAEDRMQDIDLGLTRLEYKDENRPQRAVLTLETGKHFRGGLRSKASVYWIGQGFRSQQIALLGGRGGDFHEDLQRTDRSVKATQKNIDRQHAEVFTAEVVANLTAGAKAYYLAIPHTAGSMNGPITEVSALSWTEVQA